MTFHHVGRAVADPPPAQGGRPARTDLALRAAGYGMASWAVDGMDVLAAGDQGFDQADRSDADFTFVRPDDRFQDVLELGCLDFLGLVELLPEHGVTPGAARLRRSRGGAAVESGQGTTKAHVAPAPRSSAAAEPCAATRPT
ncbi:hypothetical protein [Streptomyces hyaluromycini]|uniref:hypothetical protein n=1 Tax=Streptomyces hyaluromycini TaxID=1377993 RepID=UPI001237DBFC|nr:hypothetical protein [Streptomyces hyaluromycini]